MPTSSESFRCIGRYFDGGRARAAFADIAADSTGLIIQVEGEEVLWRKGLILVEPSAGLGCNRILRTAGGPQRLRVSSEDFVRLAPAIGKPRLFYRWRDAGKYAIAATFLLGSLAATFLIVVPRIASELSASRSEEEEKTGGERRYERFVERAKRRSAGRLEYCIHQPGREALERLVGSLVYATPVTFEPKFVVTTSSEDNAYSLSGGYIVLTRALLHSVRSEAELAGIIAHEIGHSERRHHTRSTMETATTLVTAGGLFNTPLLGWNYLLTGTNSFLAPRRREMEREADSFAIDMLTRARLDPSALGQYMQRSAEADHRGFRFLSSSHPSYDERAQTFAAARIRGREILSQSEWAQLRAICRTTTKTAPAFLQGPQ